MYGSIDVGSRPRDREIRDVTSEGGRLDTEEVDHNVFLASIYALGAVYDRSIVLQTDRTSLKFWLYYYSHFIQWSAYASVFALTLLSVVEYPCPNRLWPKRFTVPIELGLLTILAYITSIKWRFKTRRRFFNKSSVFFLIILGISYVDSIVSLFTPKNSFRVLRCLRPFFILSFHNNFRDRLRDLAKTFLSVRGVLLLGAFHVVFFSLLGVMLFYGTEEGVVHFSDFGEGLISMIVLLTTCNSPSVMMPGYKKNAWTALFFIIYAILGVILLMNLVLAVVYHEHRKHLKVEAFRVLKHQKIALKAAYNVLKLCEGPQFQGISYDLFTKLLIALDVDSVEAPLITHLIDTSRDRSLSKTEKSIDFVDFQNLAIILTVRPKLRLIDKKFNGQANPDNAVQSQESQSSLDGFPSHLITELESQHFLKMKANSSLHNLLQQMVNQQVNLGRMFGDVSVLDLFVDAVMCVSFFATIYYMATDLTMFMHREAHWLVTFNDIATVVFALEVAARCYVVGLHNYLQSGWNRFEFGIVAISLFGVVASLLVQMEATHFDSDFNILNMFRQIRQARLLLLLRHIPQFKTLTETIAMLIPAIQLFSSVILFVYYEFAIVGMYILHDIRLADNIYNANDFRDMTSAMLTLFELMIVNDWNQTMQAFVDATGTRWIRLFFITWYVVAVVVLLNSVTSFAVEAMDVRLRAMAAETVEIANEGYHLLTDSEKSASSLKKANAQQKKFNLHRQQSFRRLGVEVSAGSNNMTMVKLLNDIFEDDLNEPSDDEILTELNRLSIH